MNLRDYQLECQTAVHAQLEAHASTLAVLPTGCGKTVVFGAVARDWSHGRALVIAPTIELVDQAAAKLAAMTGDRVGIEQAGRSSCELGGYRDPYVVASKQTLMAKRNGERRYKRLGGVGLVIVDEAHGSTTEQFAEILGHFKSQGAKVLGVTATPQRADGIGLRTLFATCAYEMWIPDAIDKGWLVAPHAVCCQLESLDLSEVGTKGRRGDFKEGDLGKVMEDEKVVFEIAEVTARESRVDGRTLRTVVYCATVAEARAVAERLRDHHKIEAEWVCGDKRLCTEDRRKEVLRSLAEPHDPLTHVCNVGVLTTGWDCPNLEHIVMARPTRSIGLYTQIIGRGTRPLPGVVDFEGSTPLARRESIAASAKPHFKVTDLADNTLAHRLVGVADVLAGVTDLVGGKKKGAENKIAEEVAEQLRRGETIDVGAQIKAAQARAKQREEEEERRRLERMRIASEARYKRLEVDALGQFGGGADAAASRKGISFRMPFGKHKGKSIGELPGNYIHSLLEFAAKPGSTFNLAPKIKFLLESELSARRGARKPSAPASPEVLSRPVPRPRPEAPPRPAPRVDLRQRKFDSLMAEIDALLS